MIKKMNPRVVTWTLTILALAVVVMVYQTGNSEPVQPDVVISKTAVKADFIEMKDVPVPIKPTLGGSFMTDELLFPASFNGKTGSIFYARVEDGHVLITVEYRIKKLSAGHPVVAVYESVKTLDADYEPAGDYEVQQIERYELKEQS